MTRERPFRRFSTGRGVHATHDTARGESVGEAGGHGSRSDALEHVHVQRISVEYEYPVFFTRGVFDVDNPAFVRAVCQREKDRRHRLHIVVDNGVADAWPDLPSRIKAYFDAHHASLEMATRPTVVPGGEEAKQRPDLVSRVQAELHALGIDRQSFVVAIGGGAVLDMVGYAAATNHRGVRIIRLPTTVLSQQDSGVGVKNGINAFGAKNFLGTFSPPFAVVNDTEFIKTLTPRDRIAGISEAVKVALIRDRDFFEWLTTNVAKLTSFDPSTVGRMIRRAAELHLQHIATSGDPFEFGSARPLDFGHWAAHKLETLSSYRLRHGEAVAIGMALDARYSAEVGLLAEDDLQRICMLMEDLGFRLWDDLLGTLDRNGRPVILPGLQEFREHLGGQLTITLLCEIGRGIEVHEIDEQRVVRVLRWLETRDAERCS